MVPLNRRPPGAVVPGRPGPGAIRSLAWAKWPPEPPQSRDPGAVGTVPFACPRGAREVQTCLWHRRLRASPVPVPVATRNPGGSRHPKGCRDRWTSSGSASTATRPRPASPTRSARSSRSTRSRRRRPWPSTATTGRPPAAEPVGRRPRRGRDAVRGGRRRRPARRAPEGRARDHVHGLAGPAAHGPQHVQDRRRADARGHPRRGAHRRDPRAVDLRRPQRRDACPDHRLGDARRQVPSRRRTTSRSWPTPPRCGHASRSCTSSTASGPRTRSTRSRSSRTDDIRALVREEDVLAFRDRGLTPEAPVVRGTAQNPDVFFQAREASQPVPPGGAGHRRRRSWTSSRPGPVGATGWSTTTAPPTPTG